LDGGSAAAHDALRGKRAFELAVAGIGNLVHDGIKVNATCIVSKLNIGDLRSVAALAEELGINTLGFACAGIVGHAANNIGLLALTKGELDRAYDVVQELRTEFRVVMGGPILDWPKERSKASTNALREKSIERKGQEIAQCDICKECVTITSDGWMVPCNKFMGYRMGNVLTGNIGDVYRNAVEVKAVRHLMALRSNEMDGCEDCEFASFCSGGCRADAYAVTGSLTGPDNFRCIRRYLALSEEKAWNDGL